MIFGLPIELATMLGSSLFSGIMTMWAQKAKDEADFRMHALKSREQQYSNQIEQMKVDKGFSFTRRALAFIIVIGAMLAIFLPSLLEIPTVVELTSSSEGLFGLFTDTNTTYTTIDGFVTPEWIKHAMLSIVGLYFGNAMVKN